MLKRYTTFFSLLISLVTFFFCTVTKLPIPENEAYQLPSKITAISCYYGNRELFGKPNFHNGIDFLAPQGSYVYASSSGTVTHSGFLNGYGNCVTILHTNGMKTLYAHLSEQYIIHNGDIVQQGQVIAQVGPKYLSNGILNGWTTGPHLHFSIFDINGNSIDPLKLLPINAEK